MKSTAYNYLRLLSKDFFRRIVLIPLLILTATTVAQAQPDQTIILDNPGYLYAPANSGTFTIRATATSGLPVTYSIISDHTGSSGRTVSSGIDPVTGVITLTGNAGDLIVAYDQAGDGIWNAAARVTQTVNVHEVFTQTIFFPQPSEMTFNDGLLQILNATSSSGLPITYSILNGDNIVSLYDDQNAYYPDINETVIANRGAGQVTIRASQDGNLGYSPAVPVDRTFTVRPGYRYVTVDTPPPAEVIFGQDPFIVSASVTSVPNSVVHYVFQEGGTIANSFISSDGQTSIATTGVGRISFSACVEALDINNDSIIDYAESCSSIYSYNSKQVNTSTGALFLDRWRWENPVPPVGTLYNEVIYAQNHFIAVGDQGQIIYKDTTGVEGWKTISSGIPTSINGIAYNNVNFVAVGTDGKVYTTPDINGVWTATQVVGSNVSITSIAYANSRFVATTSDGKVIYSPNGLGSNWFGMGTSIIKIPDTRIINSVCSGKEVMTWIAVGDLGTILLSSDNGVTWVVQRSGTDRGLNDIYFDPVNNLYLAVGDEGIILTSTNGSDWSVRNAASTDDLNTIASGNGFYVALGNNGVVMTSRDGTVWTQRITRFPNDIQSVSFSQGRFIAVADNYSVFSSPTGETWTLVASATAETMHNVAHGNDAFIAVGDHGTILRKTDGSSTWNNLNAALPLALKDTDFHGIAYGIPDSSGLPIFVAVGADKAIITSADDGLSWTEVQNKPPVDTTYNDVVYGRDLNQKSLFVAVGDDFNVAISYDGQNWNTVANLPTGAYTHLNSIIYAEELQSFVVVGDGGTVLISPDGINWRYRYTGTNANLYDVAYGAQLRKLVAVGANGSILTSEKGDVWYWQSSGTLYDIRGVDYLPDEAPSTGGTFVAVGDVFQVMASTNAINWSVQISSNLNALQGLGHSDGPNRELIAVGDFQSILSSAIAFPTGLDNWIQHNPTTADVNLRSVIYQNNLYVAVGDAGSIFTSGDGFVWTKQDTGITEAIKDIAYGDNHYVAIGDKVILSSSNGYDWVVQSSWTDIFNSITYADKNFFIVGNDGLIIRSSNGTNWTLSNGGAWSEVNDGFVPDLYDITYGNGILVAVGAPTQVKLLCNGTLANFGMTAIVLSYDGGLSWYLMYPKVRLVDDEGCPIYLQSTLNGIAYANGMFLAVGTQFAMTKWIVDPQTIPPLVDSGEVASLDSAWTLPLLGGGNLNKITYGTSNGIPRFVVVGDGGILFTTLDGNDQDYHFTGVTDNLNNLVFGLETYVVVGNNGVILTSPDATSWKSQRSSTFLHTINDFVYGNNLLVAVADGGNIITSADGTTWTKRESGTTQNIKSVSFGRSRFIAVTTSGFSLSSTDGITWIPVFTGVNSDLNDVVFYEEIIDDVPFQKFVAVGSKSSIITSFDGELWADPTGGVPISNYSLNAVTFGDNADGVNTYVAVGEYGRILYSHDAKTWLLASVTSPAYINDIRDVTYGKNQFGISQFVAVGQSGDVLISNDGVTWTLLKNTAGTSYQLESIYYAEGVYVASGIEGSILTSADGIHWVARPSTTRVPLYAGYYANGLFINGGAFGTIVSANELIIRQDQVIFFPAIESQVVNAPNYVLKATTSSGLPVYYDIVEGSNLVQLVNGRLIFGNSTGEVTIRARQAGNKFYNPAESISRTFIIVDSTQTITLQDIPNQVYNKQTITLSATSDRGLTVFFRILTGPATVNGNSLTLTGAGFVEVEAYNNGINTGNNTITPARSASKSFQVSKGSQVITFPDISNKSYGDPPFLLSATSSSGLPVNYKVESGSAEFDSQNRLVIRGTGDVTINASQEGDDNFKAATPISRKFTVSNAVSGNIYLPVTNIPVFHIPSNLLGVEYVNDQFIALGQFSRILQSNDAGVWTVKSSGLLNQRDVAFGNGLYVSVGENGSVLQSEDGRSWIIIDSKLNNNINAITYADGLFIVVGDNGLIASSVDGKNWTKLNSPVTLDLSDITYGDGTYIAVGEGGTILYSTDSITWQQYTNQLIDNLKSITYGDNKFIAVGDSNSIWMSDNGTSWTIGTTNSTGLNAITYGNGRFLAVGNNGVIITSQDGILWIERNSGTTVNLNGVAYTSDIYVVVGDNDTIITSGSYSTSKFTQILTLNPLPSSVKVGEPIELTPTQTDVALPVKFVVFKGPGQIFVDDTEGKVYFKATGVSSTPIVVVASQQGDATYASVTQRVSTTATKGELSIVPPASLVVSAGHPLIELLINPDPDIPLKANQMTVEVLDASGDRVTGHTPTITTTGDGISVFAETKDGITRNYLRIDAENLTEAKVNFNIAETTNYIIASASWSVKVTGSYPDGQLITPTEGSVFTSSSPIYLEASAFDTDTSLESGIETVRFLANGSTIGTGVEIGNGHYYKNWAPAKAGNYALTVTIEDKAHNVTVSSVVNIIVKAPNGNPPSAVNLSDATLLVGRTSTFTATVKDTDGDIANVAFRVNGELVVTDTTAPYTLVFNPLTDGTYSIVATATDRNGNSRSSAPKLCKATPIDSDGSVTVNIISPIPEANPPTSASKLQIIAGASDSNGSITKVDFYVDGVFIGTDALYPYSSAWTPGTVGTFTLQAAAYDNAGNVAYSPTVDITTVPASSLAPNKVSLEAPLTYTLGGSILIKGEATDSDGRIQSAQFTLNNENLGESFTPAGANFSRFWSATTSGKYVLGLTVTDNNGNTAEATPIVVDVLQSDPFTVSIEAPLDESIVPYGSDIIIEALPANVTGSIKYVEFYADNVLISTDTVAPYSTVWTATSLNYHTILVKAIDISNTTAYAECTVQVKDLGGSAPSLNINAITANGNITESSEVIVSATTDEDATLSFFINGTQIFPNAASPYSIRIQPTALSDVKTDPSYRKYEIRVVARDAQGYTRARVINQNYVANLFFSRPTIIIDAPRAGDRITAGLPYTLRAKVSGSGLDDVAKVVFYSNGVEIGSDSSAPYQLDWTSEISEGLDEQPYILTAAVLRNSIIWDANPDNIEVLEVDVTPVALSKDVSVTVEKGSAGTSPTVKIIDPVTDSKYSRGTSLDINVEADDTDGVIKKVEVFYNNILIEQVDKAPYIVSWNPPSANTYKLTAIATDNLGNATTSAEVSVVITTPVGTLPTVGLITPADAASFTSASKILLEAGATDQGTNSGIKWVKFVTNGVEHPATTTTKPYTFSWVPPAPGTYRIVAVASDLDDNVVRSVVHTVTITPAISDPPIISFAELPSITVNQDNIIPITATDDRGIEKVVLTANGTIIATDTTAPFNFTWKPTQLGRVTLTATVTDIDGNTAAATTTVDVIAAQVIAPKFDDIPLLPTTGTKLVAGRTVNLEAFVSDADGYIVSVQFYVGVNSQHEAVIQEPFMTDWTPLSAGRYVITAVAEDNSGNRTSAMVQLDVVSNQAPTITLDYPPANAIYTLGSVIELIATAGDRDGTVASVQFLSGVTILPGEVIGTNPARSKWVPTVAGTYNISARATDDLGRTKDSPVTSVTINAPIGKAPTVSVKQPITGLTLTAVSTVLLEAAVSDADGTVSSVTFYDNGAKVATVTYDETAPFFTTLWTPGRSGVHRIVAEATDDKNNVILSEPVEFTVTNGEGVAPSISSISTNPVGDIIVGSSTFITVSATDDQRVTKVVYYVDGVKLDEDTRAPFSLKWTPDRAGKVFTLHAVAYDTSANFTTSKYIRRTVSEIVDPFDLTISCADNTKLGSDIIIEADSSSTSRLINKMSFYADNVLISEDSSAPYTVVWTPSSKGTHVIRVEALDTNGNEATPAEKSVVVESPNPEDLPPRLFVSVTANGDITEGSYVLVSATVIDDHPENETTLRFYVNGEEQAQSPNGPYIIVAPRPLRSDTKLYEIRVVATDTGKTGGNSRAIILSNLHIAPSFVTLPKVVLTSSIADNKFLAGSPVVLAANLTGSGSAAVKQVIFYVNGIEVGTADKAPFTYEWIPTLDASGKLPVTIVAAALQAPVEYSYTSSLPTIDSYPVSISTEITGTVEAQVVGPAPVVSITSPEEGTRYTIGSEITLRAAASVGEGRTIKEVEYYQVTESSGTLVRTKPLGKATEYPFEVTYTVTVPGDFIIAAVARTNTGGTGTSDPRYISIEAGSIPEITSFTTDAANNTVFKGSPITFTVEATAEDGISRIELYKVGNDQVPIAIDTTAPYVMTITPVIAGTNQYYVSVESAKGVKNRSNTITIQVKQPAPYNLGTEYNTDFIFQSFIDILFVAPTESQLSDISDSLASSTGGYTRPQLIRELMVSEQYQPIQAALAINYMFANKWSDRATLSNDVSLIQGFGYEALVQQYLSILKTTHFEDMTELPNSQSYESEIYKFLKKLWEIKYGSDTSMTDSHYKTLSFYFKNMGTVPFLSLYIRDIGNLPIGNDILTPVMLMKNPPNDRMYDWVSSAGLITNLLNDTPKQDDVLLLSTYTIIDRITLVLNATDGLYKGRYTERFKGLDDSAVRYSNGWTFSAWFGWYYEGFKPWIYHAQLGWLFPSSNTSQDVWLWSSDMGWLWTSAQMYPFIYRAQDNTWLYYERESTNPRVFWTAAGVREEH
ncbi:MAG: Ig-like domain-containing protein [Verrucomicrobiota bacterium]|nr:Ig-like domain-containing protein [Verrucomicrobiota bacterium]